MAAILSVASNVKKVVIQDREPVLQKARSYWKAQNPAAVDEGKVEFHVHDFFQEQPIKGASAYFLRHIVHEQVLDPYVLGFSSLTSLDAQLVGRELHQDPERAPQGRLRRIQVDYCRRCYQSRLSQ